MAYVSPLTYTNGIQGALPGVPPSTPAAAQPSTLDRALGILGTPGGAALVGAAGAGISAFGANKSATADRAQQNAQFQQTAQQHAAQMQQDQLNADRQHQLSQATAAVNASPMGEAQTFAQRNALLQSILGNARNVAVHPGDPAVAAAMGGGVSGGLQLPSGGLDPAMLNRMYGDASTLESIKNRQQQVGRLDPRAASMDLGSLFGAPGTQASADVTSGNQLELQRQMDDEAKQRALIQRAIDEDIRGEKQPGAAGQAQPPEGYEYDKKTGQLKKKSSGNIFGKILKTAAMGTSFIPGIGQTLSPILAGAGGLINGDGLKSSILDAGLAAIPAGLGKAAKAGKGISTAAKVARVASKVPSPVYQMGINAAIRGGQ